MVYPRKLNDSSAEHTRVFGSLTVNRNRSLHLLEGCFPNVAVVAQLLDVEQTSVGSEADLPQARQVLEPFADGKVPGVVDGGLGAQSASFLVVLLDL